MEILKIPQFRKPVNPQSQIYHNYMDAPYLKLFLTILYTSSCSYTIYTLFHLLHQFTANIERLYPSIHFLALSVYYRNCCPHSPIKPQIAHIEQIHEIGTAQMPTSFSSIYQDQSYSNSIHLHFEEMQRSALGSNTNCIKMKYLPN